MAQFALKAACEVEYRLGAAFQSLFELVHPASRGHAAGRRRAFLARQPSNRVLCGSRGVDNTWTALLFVRYTETESLGFR